MSCFDENNFTYVEGPTGQQGSTGPRGPLAALSFTGPTGIAGVTGPTGDAGVNGSIGIQGATGPAGIGLTGPVGQIGIPGIVGPAGATGVGPLSTNHAYLNSTLAIDEDIIIVNPQDPLLYENANINGFNYDALSGSIVVLTGGVYKLSFGFNGTAINANHPTLVVLYINGAVVGPKYALQTDYSQQLNPIKLATAGTQAVTLISLNFGDIIQLRNGLTEPIEFQNTGSPSSIIYYINIYKIA